VTKSAVKLSLGQHEKKTSCKMESVPSNGISGGIPMDYDLQNAGKGKGKGKSGKGEKPKGEAEAKGKLDLT
jgi:hypothetical protein